VQAVPTTYTADPFIINMEQGQNLDAPAAGTKGKAATTKKAPAKKAPAKKTTKKR
jgi:hypothetical protein